MPNYLNPQQQPPGWLDGVDDRVHNGVKYALAALLVVAAYFFSLSHPQIPMAVCMAVGLITGVLSITLFVVLIRALAYTAIVLAVAYGTYLLMSNGDAAARHNRPAPVQQVTPLFPESKI